MNLNEQIGEARVTLMNEWDESHKRCDFGDPVRGQGVRDGYYDGIEAGYRAMAKSLYREVKPEDVENGELYDVKVKGGGFQSAFALVRGAEISFWYHEMEQGEVREIFISPLEIEKVLSQYVPSPSEVFGEEVG